MKTVLKYVKPYMKLAMIAPLFMLIEASAELVTPKLMTYLIEYGVGNQDTGYIVKIGCIMLGIALIGIIGGIGGLIAASIVSQKTGRDIRKALFTKIQGFSFNNIDTFKAPSLITRLTNDITQIQMVILMTLRMLIRAPLLCLGSLIMAFSINARLTLIFVGAIVILAILAFFILKSGMPLFKKMQDMLDNVNTVMRECLSGIRVVKAFVRHDYEVQKFDTANEEYKNTGIKAFRIVLLMMPAMMIIVNTATVGILWFGSKEFYGGTLALEDIMALITYLQQMLMSLMMVAMIFVYFSRAQVSLARVAEVMAEKVDITDPENPVIPAETDGKIEYRNVVFRYKEGSGEPVLENLSFTINGGETVGILGETGCGKSTLINLLPRLYDVTEGAVLIDGVNVKDYSLHALRKKVAVILQDTILFSGSIKSNIKWGNENATDEEIIAAAKAAQAHDFIMELPNGYDTELGQKGVNVSGGQKQRISIARALLQKPEIIIFDDSTSAVDSITEKNIRRSMKETHGSCTKIIIAQRISSVREADKIMILKDGKITAEGTHDYLMKNSEDYQAIFDSQTKKGVVIDA